MKKITLIGIVFLFVSCGAYDVTYVPVTMEPIEKTFKVEGEKNDLYVKANNWLAETFVSSKDVIQFQDKESGVVTGKYVLEQFQGYNSYTGTMQDFGTLNAIIKIQVKDNAAKINVDAGDFQEVHSSLNEENRYTKEKAVGEINVLITSFETYLKNDTSTDW